MEKILIIDDSELNIHALTDILKTDYEIISAKSGTSGIFKAVSYSPTLILLDIIMPVMDGFEVLQTLKNTEETRNIPVIFITGLAEAETEAKGLLLGAVDYITKPFNARVVMARVNTHIQLFCYRKTIEMLLSIDALTGIHNRRNYDESIRLEWQHAIEKKQPLSFAILDIDHFKQHNDTYGHPQGDKTLRTIASLLQEFTQKEHFYAARYGGEEFALIFPNVSKQIAFKFTDYIRALILDLNIENSNSSVCNYITVSIGGNTLIPTSEDSLEEFIKTADQMLYKAKENGRNQVVWR